LIHSAFLPQLFYHIFCDRLGFVMSGGFLKEQRRLRGWSQPETARRLGLSQSYVAMLERGSRPLTLKLSKRLLMVFNLPPTALPPSQVREYTGNVGDVLATDLAAMGYPGFAYLRPAHWEPKNPAEVLLGALAQDDLEARLVEALPWLLLRYTPCDHEWLVREAKVRDLQNRVGFVVTLARGLAQRTNDVEKVRRLEKLEEQLKRSRLAREDTFCKTFPERRRQWVADHRPQEARDWNLLTDWTVSELRYAS
jgi:transcriptional regulator with XRE-family HTH domain